MGFWVVILILAGKGVPTTLYRFPMSILLGGTHVINNCWSKLVKSRKKHCFYIVFSNFPNTTHHSGIPTNKIILAQSSMRVKSSNIIMEPLGKKKGLVRRKAKKMIFSIWRNWGYEHLSKIIFRHERHNSRPPSSEKRFLKKSNRAASRISQNKKWR